MTTDDIQNLLPQLLAANTTGANGNAGQLQSLLSQLGNSEQATNLLVQYLANQQAAAAQPEAAFSDEDGADSLPEQDEWDKLDSQVEQEDRARRVRERFRQMRAELLALRERSDLLAEALGACYLCWGEHTDCQECHGRGRPGGRTPNRELFKQYAAPALARLQAGNGLRKNATAPKQPVRENEMG